VAANRLGEERGPAQSQGITRGRAAAIAALAAVVIALLVIVFSGSGSHHYRLVFQNASQLVPDNQVMIGGSQVGTIDEIGLTDDNLAEVKVSVDQQLHEGSTAIIRATSLSGVANHYVSISPGPNSSPELDEDAVLGLESTTTPVDLDQFINTFPNPVRHALGEFVRGNAEIWRNRGPQARETFKYFPVALNRASHFAQQLNSDQRLLARFVVSSAKLSTAVSQRGEALSDAISSAATASEAIAGQNASFDRTLRLLPPVMRQANTTFVNLRAALDDLDPLVETSKPATKNLAPFLRELRPVIASAVPVFRNLRLAVRRPGRANDSAELLGFLPDVQKRAAAAFPHAERAVEAFLPNLVFVRAYTPDIFSAVGNVGQAAANFDADGNYVRTQFSGINIWQLNSENGQLEPIPPSQQLDPYGGSAQILTRCPGGGTQPAPDGSNPFTEPPFTGADVSPSECDTSDVPPGP
jgi:phospholipid/cholesterol/gamma-HCH transport system substrate-binding protein